MINLEEIPTPASQRIPDRANGLKAVTLLAALLGAFAISHFGYLRLQPAGQFVALLWLAVWAVPAAMVILGMGIMAHDAVHKVLFSRLWINEVVGGLLSILALLPFNANRQFHLTHHAFAHQPGKDPEEPMHNRGLLSAMTLGSIVALNLQYVWLGRNVVRAFRQPRYRRRVLGDVLLILVAVDFYTRVVPALGMSVFTTFVPMFLVLPVVFGFRALSDHYGLPAIHREQKAGANMNEAELDDWHVRNKPVKEQVTGWVILTHPFLEWLWSNVNYHEVHHKFPWLSHIYLKDVFALTRAQLPYAVVQGYSRSLWQQRGRRYFENSDGQGN